MVYYRYIIFGFFCFKRMDFPWVKQILPSAANMNKLGLLVAIKDLKDEGTIGLPSGQPFIRQTHLAGVNYTEVLGLNRLNPMNFTHVNHFLFVFSSSFGYLA